MLPPLFIKIMGNFLQILSDNIISIYIFIAFVIIQYIFFSQCQKKIGNIKKIFPRSSYSVIRNDEGIIQINTVSGYDIYNEIITKINNYISENSDCVDLNEMKDIVNRITDKEFNSAVANRAFPMYLGLMGTYSGIAFGLGSLVWAMVENTDKMFGSEAVYTFIGGVVVAMLTSFFGLIFTTLNNNSASLTSKYLDSEKDTFFSLLQTEVLPLVPSTLAQTLKEEFQSSISSLGQTIGNLNTTISSLNTELKSTFENITQEFGNKLSNSLRGIQETVKVLTESSSAYVESMRKQDEILNKLNSPAFATVLNKICTTIDKCESANSKIEEIKDNANIISEKQSEINEQQNVLLTSQTELINAQKSAVENIKGLKNEFGKDVVELHEQLNNISISSQERLNTLLKEPSAMFNYIKETLEQFKVIANFVENVAENEFTAQSGRIEYINNQLSALEKAGDTVKNYLAQTKQDLENYLDSEKSNIKNSAKDFVMSWNRMFSEMSANEVENPLAYLRNLSSLQEKLDSIQLSIKEREEETKIIEQLNGIKEQLDVIAKKKEIIGGKGAGNIKPIIAPINYPSEPKGLMGRISKIFQIKKSKKEKYE